LEKQNAAAEMPAAFLYESNVMPAITLPFGIALKQSVPDHVATEFLRDEFGASPQQGVGDSPKSVTGKNGW
jgi:hypothetical protein